jgi:hypothetical protein
MAEYNFRFLSDIENIQLIAAGKGVKVRHHLDQKHGHGRWRKLKGTAIVEYSDGQVWLAEIHWFEAHGIGRKDFKSIRRIERIA